MNFISGYFVGFAVTLPNSNFGTEHKADETSELMDKRRRKKRFYEIWQERIRRTCVVDTCTRDLNLFINLVDKACFLLTLFILMK